MSLEEVARKLADQERIGLYPELVKKLGIPEATPLYGRLMAMQEDAQSYFGVYLLATYVVDDTDWWGDGEIYWWSIPVMVDRNGMVQKNVMHGLPMGAEPHKCGSLEWMTNISLANPPLLALIPATEEVASCVLRIAFYDDDAKPADMPAAITAGLEAWANVSDAELKGADQIITPVRQAIFSSLKAEEDDILVDQDVIMRRGETSKFSAGLVSSIVNAMARVYYFVKDEERTEQFGPVVLHKGQMETVKFASPMKAGGRLALFSRGANVNCSAFGDLDTETPFMNRVIEQRYESSFTNGFEITGTGPAKFIAFYTPPG